MPRSLNILLAVCVLVCITSALRIAPPRRCTNGIMGTCKPGGKCPTGSYCSSNAIGRRRLCCRTKPLRLCPFGSTGRCSRIDKKCAKGSTCKFQTFPFGGKPSPFGECCKNKPDVFPPPIRVCLWGSMGRCDGKIKCPPGTSCKPDKDGRKYCCRDRPIIKPPIDDVCKFGSVGICGISGLKCGKGSTCRYPKSPFPGPPLAIGRCCRDKPIIKPPNGECRDMGLVQDGICGGIAGLRCRPGTVCMFKDPITIADGAGKCCVMKKPPFPPLNKFCPKPSSIIGICAIQPGKNCRSNIECGKDELCCTDQCGRFCKKAVGRPIILPPKNKVCPKPSGNPGICVFKPGVNCLSDAECGKDELCCSEGCGKVCKKAVDRPIILPPINKICPRSSGNFGVCEFKPELNCIRNEDCSKDQLCCFDKCGRVCKKAVSFPIRLPTS